MSIHLELSVMHLNYSWNWASNVDLGTGTLFIVPGTVWARLMYPWNLHSIASQIT